MEYVIHLLILVGIYAILAMTLNLVVGYTGLLSVTHAAFYGIGAYSVALLMTLAQWNFFPALLVGILASCIAGFFIGRVLSELGGDYYVLGTVGFNFIIYSIFLNWQNLTRGPLGIPGIPKPELFGISLSSNAVFLLLVIACGVVVWGLCRWITRSSFGRALKGIREDEIALQVFGYKTINYKLIIFMISAGLASVAGGLFAAYISFIDPSTFTVDESIFILAIIILGGLANLRGSLLGALFLVLLPELLRFVGFPTDIAAQMRLLTYGVLLVVLMMYRPQGLVGEYKLQ